MSRIADGIWSRLGLAERHDLSVWARPAMPAITSRLLAGTGPDGKRHLLIRLQDDEADLSDAQSRGISAETSEFNGPGEPAHRYLDITCHETMGHDGFDMIGGELADRLAAGTDSAPEAVASVLAKWRRFWSQVPRKLLSREEQLGLFAELWFLTYWLIPMVGPIEAVRRWRGPFKARHDFEWTGRAVEVKATTSTRGPIHWINGIEQLVAPTDGDLLVFSLRVREEASATSTLPALVLKANEAVATNSMAQTMLEAALAEAAYEPAQEADYSVLRLRVLGQGLYAVRDDFPRLTPDSLNAGMPSGVEHLEYEINLGTFGHLCLAREPSQLSSNLLIGAVVAPP